MKLAMKRELIGSFTAFIACCISTSTALGQYNNITWSIMHPLFLSNATRLHIDFLLIVQFLDLAKICGRIAKNCIYFFKYV